MDLLDRKSYLRAVTTIWSFDAIPCSAQLRVLLNTVQFREPAII